MTQNDEAWGKIFERLHLLPEIEHHGFVYVSADDIKTASDKREPRLLAKQDTRNSRPEVFKQNKLSILPVENGKYIIFRDESTGPTYPLDKILAEVPAEEYQPSEGLSAIPKASMCGTSLLNHRPSILRISYPCSRPSPERKN